MLHRQFLPESLHSCMTEKKKRKLQALNKAVNMELTCVLTSAVDSFSFVVDHCQ